MRHLILFSLFSVLAVAAFSQPGTRIKLRQLEAAPGSDYYIRSVNDTCAWVMNSEFADSLSVLQDSIIVLYADGSEVSRDTVGPFGSTGQVYYQLLRNDGSDQTERNSTNFISTSTVVATLLDDSGSDETEVRMSVPTGGITSAEILDGTITTSDLAFTPVTGSGTTNYFARWSSSTALTDAALFQNANGIGWTRGAASGNMIIQGLSTKAIGGTYCYGFGEDIFSTGIANAGNIAIGYGVLKSVTTSNAYDNIGIGRTTLDALTTGNRNIAIGYDALGAANTGLANTAVGFEAGRGITSGSNNFALGEKAMYTGNHTSGIAIGSECMRLATGGNYNIGIGFQSLYSASGNNTVAIGRSSGRNNTGGGIYIGYAAGSNETGANKLYIHNQIDANPLIGGDFSSRYLGVNTTVSSLAAALHVTGTGATSSTYAIFAENSSGTDLFALQNNGALGILENLPARTLDVGGEVRIQDLTTDPPTGIIGHDGDGDLGTIAPGYGLSLSSSVLEVDTADLATQYDLLGVLDTVTYGRILFVSKNGNDGTGEIGNPHKCYLTIGGAYADATDGDLLYFFPGSYTSTSNLGTKSLSWYLMPGVNLSGAGMQFDLSAGVKVRVFGSGVLSFTSGSVAMQANSAGEFISIEADSIYTNHFYFARTANGGQVYFNVRAVDMGSNCLNLFRLDGGKSTVNGSMSVIYSGVNNILVANQDTGTYKICKLDIDVLVWTSTFYIVSISSDLNNSYIGLQINKLIDDSATTGGVFRFSNSGSTSSSRTVFSVNVKNYSGPQHFIDAVNGSIAADSTSTAYINCDNCRYTGTSAAILTRSSFGSTSYLRYVISGNWVSESAPLIKDSVSTNTFPIPLSIKDARLKVENGSYYAVHVYGFASTGSMFFRNVFFEGQSSGVPAISCATASTFRTAGAYQSNSDVDADATFVKYYELE